METATQTLHRLTSYQPGRDWDEAVDDPRIVQDLEASDMSRLPWSAGGRFPLELYVAVPPGGALPGAGPSGGWTRAAACPGSCCAPA